MAAAARRRENMMRAREDAPKKIVARSLGLGGSVPAAGFFFKTWEINWAEPAKKKISPALRKTIVRTSLAFLTINLLLGHL